MGKRPLKIINVLRNPDFVVNFWHKIITFVKIYLCQSQLLVLSRSTGKGRGYITS